VTTVLFACIHNAGRSQMAAAWFNALSDPTEAHAISAGTEPGARVHPEVVEAMREVGIDLSSAVPQRLTDALAQSAKLLVTMGCGEACPAVPWLRRLDWALEDPKGKPIARVREIRDEVRRRVGYLIAAEGWAPSKHAAVTIGPAGWEDTAAVYALIEEAGLPSPGIRLQYPDAYAIAWRRGEIVGVAGLEVYGTAGLLRSVAVARPLRGAGMGRRLVADRLAAARALGLDAVYLLTTTAGGYFEALGFAPAPRPAVLAASPELTDGCPSSATCMVLRLRG